MSGLNLTNEAIETKKPEYPIIENEEFAGLRMKLKEYI